MWTIKTWSTSERRGSIVGPHLGPLSFGPEAADVLDYHVGEEVTVELKETTGNWVVLRVTPLSARQPPGTNAPEFDSLNALRLWDFHVESLQDDALTVVGGNDPTYHRSATIRFTNVSFFSGPLWFSHALFRRASADEVEKLRRNVEVDGVVFCIVTEHGNGPDGPSIFVVAERAECTL